MESHRERIEGCTCTITGKERMGEAKCPVHTPDQPSSASDARDLRPGDAPESQGVSYTLSTRPDPAAPYVQDVRLPVPGRNHLRWYRVLDRCPGAVLLLHRRSGTYRLVSDTYIAEHLAGLSIHRRQPRQGPVRGPSRGPAREALDGPIPDTLRGAG